MVGAPQAGLLVSVLSLGALSLLESHLILRSTGYYPWAYYGLGVSSAFYAVCFIMAFVAWDVRRSTVSRAVERIGRRSYGLYLLNPKTLSPAARAVHCTMPGLFGQQLLLTASFLVLGLGVPWLLMSLVAKSPVRKAYRYLFG